MHAKLEAALPTIFFFVSFFVLRQTLQTNLHNEEMRIVDIELNRTEQVLDSCVVCIASIYQILVSATNHNLKCKNTIQYQFFVADCITMTNNDVHKLFQVLLKVECKLAQESLCNNIILQQQ